MFWRSPLSVYWHGVNAHHFATLPRSCLNICGCLSWTAGLKGSLQASERANSAALWRVSGLGTGSEGSRCTRSLHDPQMGSLPTHLRSLPTKKMGVLTPIFEGSWRLQVVLPCVPGLHTFWEDHFSFKREAQTWVGQSTQEVSFGGLCYPIFRNGCNYQKGMGPLPVVKPNERLRSEEKGVSNSHSVYLGVTNYEAESTHSLFAVPQCWAETPLSGEGEQ